MEAAEKTARLLMQVSGTLLNSLNSAIAASDLMARQLERQNDLENAESISNQLAMLRRSQFQILRVADNMKTLAALELNRCYLTKQTVDLWQLCADLADAVHVLVPDTEISVLPSSDSFLTFCDPDLIEKLLLNLIANSLRHCGEAGAIRIQLARNDDTLQIIVADNGSGIPRETMQTLFSDYLRETDFSDAARGSGLGLSVAEAIAKAHGGSLIVTGEPEHGAKAVFSLPHAWAGELRGSRGIYSSNSRMRKILEELSDVCDFHKFQSPFL